MHETHFAGPVRHQHILEAIFVDVDQRDRQHHLELLRQLDRLGHESHVDRLFARLMDFGGHFGGGVLALFQYFRRLLDVRETLEDALVLPKVFLGGLAILGFERNLRNLVVSIPMIRIEPNRGVEFGRIALWLTVAFECVGQLETNRRVLGVAAGGLFQLRDGPPHLPEAQVSDAGEIVCRRRMAVDGQHLFRFSQRLFVHAGLQVRPGQVQTPRRLHGEQLDCLAECFDGFFGFAVFVMRFADVEQRQVLSTERLSCPSCLSRLSRRWWFLFVFLFLATRENEDHRAGGGDKRARPRGARTVIAQVTPSALAGHIHGDK